MNIKFKNTINKKIYNIFLLILTWVIFILLNYFNWYKIIDLTRGNNLLLLIYLFLSPIILGIFILKLARLNNKKEKRNFLIGIILSIVIYYIIILLLIYFIISAVKNFFPF
jgi:hypothetical protein